MASACTKVHRHWWRHPTVTVHCTGWWVGGEGGGEDPESSLWHLFTLVSQWTFKCDRSLCREEEEDGLHCIGISPDKDNATNDHQWSGSGGMYKNWCWMKVTWRPFTYSPGYAMRTMHSPFLSHRPWMSSRSVFCAAVLPSFQAVCLSVRGLAIIECSQEFMLFQLNCGAF